MSSLHSLPADLLLDILADIVEDCIKPGANGPAAYRLFKIATLSRTCYILINALAERKVKKDLDHLEELRTAPNSSCSSMSFSPLSVLCRRIGWICSFCGNRSRTYPHPPHGEIFTDLPVCQACEAFILPKITFPMIEHDYSFTNREKVLQELQKVPRVISSKSHKDRYRDDIYRWQDIEKLVKSGLLKPRRVLFRNRREDYAYFRRDYTDPEWTKPRPADNLRTTFFAHIQCVHLYNQLQSVRIGDPAMRGPIIQELALFREFLSQFDHSYIIHDVQEYRQKYTLLQKYGQIAVHWAMSNFWASRPWGLTSFPLPPRCTVANPSASERLNHKAKDHEQFIKYQTECRKRRLVIQKYPLILAKPTLWCRVMDSSGDNESTFTINEETEKDLLSPVPKYKNMCFELWRLSQTDTAILRVGANLRIVRYPDDLTPRPQWAYPAYIHRNQIVRVKGDKVSLTNPNYNTRKANVRPEDMMFGN